MKEICLLLILVVWGQVFVVNAEAPEPLRLHRTKTFTGNSSSSVLLTVPQTSTILVELNVFVGQVIRVIIPENFTSISADQGFPRWMEIQNGSFVGIPDVKNVGQTDVKIETAQHGTTVFRITVNTESVNPCGENVTSWLDTYFQESPTLGNMVKAAEMIRGFNSGLDGKTDTLRVYTHNYASKNRDLEEIGQEDFNGTFVVSFAASCGDFEEVFDIMADFLDFDNATTEVKLARGYYKLGSTTTITTTLATVPTTTPVPEVKKILKAVCTRGQLCKVDIPRFTFEKEDRKHRDNSIGIRTPDHQEIFLHYWNNRQFTGYPLKEGNFTSHITKLRDNKTTENALLMVQIDAQPDSNHYIQLDMSRPSCSVLIEKPRARIDLMNQLYYALKGPKNSLMLHDITCVNNITRVRFSNTTIKADSCDIAAVHNFSVKMITEHLQKTNYVFIQAMNAFATVRKAVLILSGPCAILKPPSTTSTTNPPLEFVKGANYFTVIMFSLVAVCMIFIVSIIGLTYQDACMKRNQAPSTSDNTVNHELTEESQEVAETFV